MRKTMSLFLCVSIILACIQIRAHAQSPGGVSGAAVWIKADAGVTASGTNITAWTNQANTSNNFTATNSPQLSTGAVNFNPTVAFSGGNYFTSAATVPTGGNYTKLVVYRNTNGGNTLSAGGSGNSALFGPNESLTFWHGGIIAATPTGSANPGRQYIGTAVFNSGVTNGSILRLNGNATTFTTSTAYIASTLSIGATQGANNIGAGSNVAEAVVYNSPLGITNLQQVESYLALKYGLTLQYNYLASDGTTTPFTLGSYSNNITGIGRDDNTALNQKQSQSSNEGSQLAISIGSIAATNQANAGTVTSNLQFLVWGDNQLAGYTVNAGISQKRLAKTWQLQNTNAFGQQVTLYYPVSGLSGIRSVGITPSLIYGSTAASLNDGSATSVTVNNGTITLNGESYLSFTVTFPTTGTLYFTFSAPVHAEICDNGIDDDLDGYVDKLDSDCVPVITCSAPSSTLASFGIRQKWVSSAANALGCSATPTVADLDGDGIPEIITVRAGGAGFTYFKGDGSNLSKNTVDYNIQMTTQSGQSTMQTAVADIDRDGIPEVIAVSSDGYVYVFNNVSGSSTVYKYRSASPITSRFNFGSPRVVDVDEDGTPEIIVGLDVFRFNFGEGRLVKVISGSSTAPSGLDGTPWGNEIVVIDILPANPGKEIVAGSKVYGVNMSTSVTTILADLSTIAGIATIPTNDDGPTAVADLDNDGNLDIAYVNGTKLVIWDPIAGVLKSTFAYDNRGGAYANQRGMPAVANIYDEQALNGQSANWPEIIFTSSLHLYAFNLHKITGPVWDLATTDDSGETGITAFDLNGDGILEIVYNDQSNIRIINGNTATPANIATYASGTATWNEHPVVADVDGDGIAEFACVTNGTNAVTGMLRVFSYATGTTPWQATRKVWNGRGYRTVNVNDDLTIPVTEQDIRLQYPTGSGRYPINVYNAQVDPRQLPPGNTPAPDLVSSDFTRGTATDTICNISSVPVSYKITNNGSVVAAAGTPIRFYYGDPTTTGATRLSTTATLTNSLAVGASVIQTSTLDLSGLTPPYNSYYVVINDDGSTSTPITFPVIGTNVKECNYTNNIASATLNPVTVDYGNIPTTTWPAAYAVVPRTGAVWLGTNAATTECSTSLTDPTDGLGRPSIAIAGGNTYPFTVTMNAANSGTTVYYRLWFDWNNDGNFANDLDGDGNPATYAGSGVTASSVMVSFPVKAPIGLSQSYKARLVASNAPVGDYYRTQGNNYVMVLPNGEVEDYAATAYILPVSMLEFTAQKVGSKSLLNWKTATEQNSSYFDIERSTDGRNFVSIGRVMAAGNSTMLRNYNLTDAAPVKGANYYRLKQANTDGSFTYSELRLLNFGDRNIIMLYPNPAKDYTTIIGIEAGMQVELWNATGQRLQVQKAIGNSIVLTTGSLLAGMYEVHVRSQSGTIISTQKLIKR